MKKNFKFLFMYPIYETNSIIAAYKNGTTKEATIDFDKILDQKDIKINGFPLAELFVIIITIYISPEEEKIIKKLEKFF